MLQNLSVNPHEKNHNQQLFYYLLGIFTYPLCQNLRVIPNDFCLLLLRRLKHLPLSQKLKRERGHKNVCICDNALA